MNLKSLQRLVVFIALLCPLASRAAEPWGNESLQIIILLGAICVAVVIVVLNMSQVQKRLRREIVLRKGVEEKLVSSCEMLRRTGELAKVGGFEIDFINNRTTFSDEAARIREIEPGTALSYEQTLSFFDPETQSIILAAKDAAIKKGVPWDHEVPLTTAKGNRVWVRARGEAVVRDGKTVLLVGSMQDISDRKLVELELRRRTRELEMHNSIFRKIYQGTALDDMLYFLINQVEELHPEMLCSILLLDAEGKRLYNAVAPSLPDSYTKVLNGVAIGEGVGSCGTAAYRGERVITDNLLEHPYWAAFRELVRSAGLQSCWSQPISNFGGIVVGVFAIYHRQPATPSDDEIELLESYARLADLIIERSRTEEKIRSLAYYDALTQLPNRRMLDDRLGLAMALSKRSSRYGALMFLDLDNFKPLNDTHGHSVGDLLLIQAAQRISACVREMDTVARFGGDEFVVMLSELNEDKAESVAMAGQVAEKIRSALAEPYVLTVKHNGKADELVEHCCTASIGVALFVNHEASLDDILKWADLAMYQAKDAGRNSIWFYG